MHRRPARRRRPVRQNFALNVVGGAAVIMALEYGSVRLVVPWIGQHLQVPYILVALILPLHEFCMVTSQLLLAPRVARFVLRKRSVSSLAITFAALFALIFIVASLLQAAVAGIALLLSAAALGLGLAIYNVSRNDPRTRQYPVVCGAARWGGKPRSAGS
jgi:MFS family permease